MRRLLLVAAACCAASALRAPALRAPALRAPHAPLHPARGCLRAPALRMMAERKGGLFGAVDDVLDYLTNMGGYTGFTEEELKGGEGVAADLDNKDMDTFGQPTTGIDDNVTSGFVILLILFPSTLMFIGIQLFGVPSLFTFAT